MAIDKVNGAAWTDLSKISSITKANISKFSGHDAPSGGGGGGGGGGEIAFTDVTESAMDTTWSTTQPFNASLPSTASSGDFVMILFANDSPTGNIAATPTGWTLRKHVGDSTSDNHLLVYTRTFDGTEGSTVPIYSTISTSRGMVAWSMIVDNIDTTTPFGTFATVISGSGTSMTVPTQTSSSAGTFIVFVGFDGADGDPITMTNNGGFTLTLGGDRDVPTGGGSTHLTSEWRYANIGASTATGTTSVTFNASDGKAGMSILLQKA